MPFWRILTNIKGTCLTGLFLDPLFWGTMAIYIGVRVTARLSDDDTPIAVALLSKSDINILGGFLSFFLVFFVNQTNTRFLEMVSKGVKYHDLDSLFFIKCEHVSVMHIRSNTLLPTFNLSFFSTDFPKPAWDVHKMLQD